MLTKTQVGSSSPRICMFYGRQLKSEAIKLERRKSCKINLWLKIWRKAESLPQKYRKELEIILAKSMSHLRFSFQAGHKIYNEGLCNRLGRVAMLVGIIFVERDLKKKLNIRHARVLERMKKSIGFKKGFGLDEEERRIISLLQGI